MSEGHSTCERLAAHAGRAAWRDLPPAARDRLKQHLLDALGCALGALKAGVSEAVRAEQDEFAPQGPSAMIGGGKYLDPMTVRTKEDADHSLAYLMAVALLDGEVSPRQFEPGRISRPDVQTLLRSVSAAPNDAYTAVYPRSMCCRVIVELADERRLEAEKSDYLGYATRPMAWDDTVAKFLKLGSDAAPDGRLRRIVDLVAALEDRKLRDLMAALQNLPGRA